jgi:hypothetical protein
VHQHFQLYDYTSRELCVFQASVDIWLSVWTKAEAEAHEPAMQYYMTVYVGLGMASVTNYFLRRLVLLAFLAT